MKKNRLLSLLLVLVLMLSASVPAAILAEDLDPFGDLEMEFPEIVVEEPDEFVAEEPEFDIPAEEEPDVPAEEPEQAYAAPVVEDPSFEEFAAPEAAETIDEAINADIEPADNKEE